MDDLITALMPLVQEAETAGVHGLLFQHAVLCPTRGWLHYHRVDCAHLNRHMKAGMVAHEIHYEGAAQETVGYGIRPDLVDWGTRTVSEVKRHWMSDRATKMQLAFYMAVLTVATGARWRGAIRVPTTRRVTSVEWSTSLLADVQAAWVAVQAIIAAPDPPRSVARPICQGCSYRLLCWGQSTEEVDT